MTLGDRFAELGPLALTGVLNARPGPTARDLFRTAARSAPEATSYAEVYLYDEIGGWGITAADLVAQLAELDVAEIDLHINSPGGFVWDGIAMYNALVNHRAKVTSYVDGMAASAASIVAMAGDHRIMSQGAQMMIHDAWGHTVGNAADHEKMRDVLDHESNNLAAMYAQRSGGTAKEWRKAMLAETWYTADEAVSVGLADEVAKRTADVAARWDLRVFGQAHGYRYPGGRAEAPAPTFRHDPARTVTDMEDSAPADTSDASVSAAEDDSEVVAPPPADRPAPPGPGQLPLPPALPPAALSGALQAAAGVPDYQIDPGTFRAAMGFAVNAVDPVEPAPVAAPPPTTAQMVDTFVNAFKEAVR